MVTATDATWEEFMRGCVRYHLPDFSSFLIISSNNSIHRSRYPRTAPSRTTGRLRSSKPPTMLQLFNTMRNNPPVYSGSIVFDLTIFKSHIYNTPYSPSAWPGLARAPDDLLRGNLDTFAARFGSPEAAASRSRRRRRRSWGSDAATRSGGRTT
ncbi:hypothetical protein F4818DRAFT_423889 [Hypoxylon cercidicola]|nr:hypothetical protein F4818DRAFT_423889 [Hypoxylon cercidicola]